MINKDKLPRRKFRLVKDGDCKAISLVSRPAVESSFKLFSAKENQDAMELFSFNKKKMQISGIAMRNGYEMERINEETGEHYIGYFDAEEIEHYAQYYFKNSHNLRANFEHGKRFSNKLFVFLSWIVKTEKEAEAFQDSLGIKEIGVGDWLVTYQITDEKLFEDIANSDLTGFSVEVQADVFNEIDEEKILNQIKYINYSNISNDEKLLKIEKIISGLN